VHEEASFTEITRTGALIGRKEAGLHREREVINSGKKKRPSSTRKRLHLVDPLKYVSAEEDEEESPLVMQEKRRLHIATGGRKYPSYNASTEKSGEAVERNWISATASEKKGIVTISRKEKRSHSTDCLTRMVKTLLLQKGREKSHSFLRTLPLEVSETRPRV